MGNFLGNLEVGVNMGQGEKRFRYAWVLKPGFNFVPLGPYCERIMFATDGYADTVEEQWNQLRVKLLGFDADRDVLIPIGSAALCSMAATVLTRLCESSHLGVRWTSYAMGVYKENDYIFWRVPTNVREDAYDILMS